MSGNEGVGMTVKGGNGTSEAEPGQGQNQNDPLIQMPNINGFDPEGKPDKVFQVPASQTLTTDENTLTLVVGTDPGNKWIFLDNLLKWVPNERLISILIAFILPLITWAIAFLLGGSLALPGGSLFAVFVLGFGGIAIGSVISIAKLPPLLGMLLVGILIRNVPFIDYGKYLSAELSSHLRQIALVVILIRAGLGLDMEALVRLKGVVLRLAFTPCIAEAITVGIAAHFILGFPWAWGLLLGFVLGAVSPAVVVPCLLSLKERGYGVEKGIPTIVIAAASIDDILAISLFGVMLGFALTKEGSSLTDSLIQGPIELILGITFGILWGVFLGLIPAGGEKKQTSRESTLLRSFLLLSGGILSVFGFQYIKYPGAGALGCLCSTLIAATFWRKKNSLADDDDLSWTFSILWLIFQPLLFGLIGCEIDLLSIDPKIVGQGMLCLIIALTVRLLVSILATSGGGLTLKERLFIAIAWVPKATVQAAIGPVALDAARKLGAGESFEDLGLEVLTISILSILFTAPFGALAITAFGPRLLDKKHQDLAI